MEESRGVVVIVDSVEKLRGTRQNDADVQTSIESLFVHHSEKLRFDSVHTVYTVPASLMFTDPGALPFDGAVRPVPVPHLRRQDGERDTETLSELTDVVQRRLEWRQLLAGEHQLVRVIDASGGHLRDLFRLLQELITLVNSRGVTLPVEDDHVEDAISKVSLGFSQITREDADFLHAVHESRGDVLPSLDQVSQIARLMATHMVLVHLNSRTWYEVHPLALRHLLH